MREMIKNNIKRAISTEAVFLPIYLSIQGVKRIINIKIRGRIRPPMTVQGP
jgi:hypothetical protein